MSNMRTLPFVLAADDDFIPLMTVETFPRLPGGVRAALDSLQ